MKFGPELPYYIRNSLMKKKLLISCDDVTKYLNKFNQKTQKMGVYLN